MRILVEQSRPIRALAFTPDSRFLVAAGDGGTVRLWPVDDHLAESIALKGQAGAIQVLTLSKDGTHIAAGRQDGTIEVWRFMDTQDLAGQVCDLVSRNLTRDEWDLYIGDDIEYECTCPGLGGRTGTAGAACSSDEMTVGSKHE